MANSVTLSSAARRVFMAILFAIALGIATHLVWDALPTNILAMVALAVAATQVKIPVLGHVPTYMALQYASTILGLVALGIWVLLWYRNTPPKPALGKAKAGSGPRIALIMIAVAIAVALVRAWLAIGVPKTLDATDAFMLTFGVTSIAIAFWEVLIYCVMISSHQTWTIS